MQKRVRGPNGIPIKGIARVYCVKILISSLIKLVLNVLITQSTFYLRHQAGIEKSKLFSHAKSFEYLFILLNDITQRQIMGTIFTSTFHVL